MATFIRVTKVASAYVELESDSPVTIDAEFIKEILPLSKSEDLGGAILFFIDGSTMNVTESIGEIFRRINRNPQRQFLFGMN